jgi:hypothetical protein
MSVYLPRCTPQIADLSLFLKILSVQGTNQISLGSWELPQVSAHAISDYVIRTARGALSAAARNAQTRRFTLYSTLVASLLYEELQKELGATQAHEARKQDVLTKAIDRCRRAAGLCPDGAVEELRAVLELLETGVPLQAHVTPQDRRAQLRVIQGGLSPSKAVVSPSKAQLREIG